jgi:inosine-uridine nucleoside N-ribohydrolase
VTRPALFVEADNGMGSARGDVDDGFALGALLGAAADVRALGSVFGNVPEAEADRNNRALCAAMGATVRHVRGSVRPGDDGGEAAAWLCAQRQPLVVLALGPLSTLAAALARGAPAVREVVLVGGDASSRGRWPPLWPYEFNLRLDRAAAARVFASGVPITVAPLDVGRRALLSRGQLAAVPGAFGRHARAHAERWFRRARRWQRRDAIRVYDLLAVACAARPEALRVDDARATMHRRGWLEFGRGRPVRVVRDFDPSLFDLLTAPGIVPA